ncbi:MAG: CocE/NonD family hydrolase [Moorellaceae bacterium]
MFSVKWQTSKREYGIIHERDVTIPVSAGFNIDCDILRPDAPGRRFPVILCMSPYAKSDLIKPLMPVAMCPERAHIEAGDYNFYVRRGYVQVFANVRGTGRSGGLFDHLDDGMVQDMYDVIEWLARQPWCDGQVATFGASYFAMMAKRVATLKPPSLKTIFAPFGTSDQYRQAMCRGGILNADFLMFWIHTLDNVRIKNDLREKFGEAGLRARIEAALADPEISQHPGLVECLHHPDEGRNPFIVKCVLNYLDNEYYRERSVDFSKGPEVPAYFGGCWGMYSLHLPGDVQSFENWKGPKKLTIGPPYYLDRPVYQYQYESLRWFDYWLKGVDTGIMDEPPIHLFIMNTGEWKEAYEWPLPEAKWTEFFLHENGLLSEHEIWPHETCSSFNYNYLPDDRGSLTFVTPRLVENTEVCGPLVLNFYASTTDTEVLWFVDFFEVDETGKEHVLCRGWLRGSQRRLDPEKSRPWWPYHLHTKREPLTPGEVYEFNIPLGPVGVLFRAGMRFGVRIKCSDRGEKARDFLDQHALGNLSREVPAKITVYHSNEYPSHLLVPITRGNRVGTFMSGGQLR